MKRVFDFIVLVLVAVAFVVLSSDKNPAFSQQQQLGTIPQEIETCLPKPSDDPTSMISYQFQYVTKQEVGNQAFHLLLVKDASDPRDYPWDTLIKVEGDQCENLIPLRAEVRTLTQFVPLEIAKQLALARYQELQKTPAGKRAIQRQLKVITVPPGSPTDVDMDEYILAPEDDWALRELGYSIPSNFKTYPVETPAPSNQP